MSDNVSHQTFIQNLMANIKEMTVDGLSGGVAAFITNLLFHPLENIRTRLQDYSEKDNEQDDLEKVCKFPLPFMWSLGSGNQSITKYTLSSV